MLENLPKEIFSSFRIVYVAYILLIFFGKFENEVSLTDFLITSGMLMTLVIIHDDYLRKVLNGWGDYDGKNIKISFFVRITIIPIVALFLGYWLGKMN